MHASMTQPERVQNRIHTAAVTTIRDRVNFRRLESGWSPVGVLGASGVEVSVVVKSCMDEAS